MFVNLANNTDKLYLVIALPELTHLSEQNSIVIKTGCAIQLQIPVQNICKTFLKKKLPKTEVKKNNSNILGSLPHTDPNSEHTL